MAKSPVAPLLPQAEAWVPFLSPLTGGEDRRDYPFTPFSTSTYLAMARAVGENSWR